MIDYKDLHQKIIPVIEEAEQILQNSFGQLQQITVKEGLASQASLVTETDQKVDA